MSGEKLSTGGPNIKDTGGRRQGFEPTLHGVQPRETKVTSKILGPNFNSTLFLNTYFDQSDGSSRFLLALLGVGSEERPVLAILRFLLEQI